MKILIVGLGYVGVTAAACLTSDGHTVVGVDVSSTKVIAINEGRSPITETGIDVLLSAARAGGLLSATTTLPDLHDVDLVIVCVGTPSAPDGSHNMSFIAEATRQIAEAARTGIGAGLTVAYRSTFKPGTMETLVRPIFKDLLGDFSSGIELVYNPEFLRESTAIQDFRSPPKIVIGTEDGAPSATMDKLHEGLDAPVFNVPFRDAEFTKFVDNTWHAVKVTFANEVGRVAHDLGVSARTVHEIFVSDTKLNISPYYTRPGGPFGGSCLPKDVRALQYLAREAHADARLIESLMPSNDAHKAFSLDRVAETAAPGARILVVGLAFKAGTDDLRESPNVDLVVGLIEAGYDVSVFDPNVDSGRLVGQNLGALYATLPTLNSYLIDEDEANVREFDLVVSTSAGIVHPSMVTAPVLDLGTIP